MHSKVWGSFAALIAALLTLPARAQDSLPATQAAPGATTSPATLTGKERLGPKWMDEQRIDNCKIPVDKRGTRPRPSACPPIPMG